MANENPEVTSDETVEKQPLKVFVTGASTGIGRVITRLLVKQGMHVIGATDAGSSGATLVREDGGLPCYPDLTRSGEIVSILQMSKVDVIVHAAAQVLNAPPQLDAGWVDRIDWLRSATGAVAEAAGQAGVKKLIFLSMAAAYGDQHGAAVNESSPLSRSNAFYKAVAAAEAAVLDGGVQGYVLRAGTVLGASTQALIRLSEQMRVNKSVPTGAGLSAWVHEDDLADAVLRVIERDSSDDAMSNIFNIAMDEAASPDSFINSFGQALGVGTPTRSNFDLRALIFGEEPVRAAMLNDSLSVDCSQAHSVLGWKPQFNSVAIALERILLEWRASEAPLLLPEPAAGSGKELAIR